MVIDLCLKDDGYELLHQVYTELASMHSESLLNCAKKEIDFRKLISECVKGTWLEWVKNNHPDILADIAPELAED